MNNTLLAQQTWFIWLRSKKGHQIKKSILYSILDKRPKRAQVYWFITMVTTDSPYTHDYTVETYGTKNVVQVTIYLGFKKITKS
ncbi:KUP/HAK/KT family potassium transporter [Holzapfeliella floricola]|uniref:KUP/HAK/KT family potassium transporter n=1 Tax=Holzapfeliella floricola TaxID=679249 RepID=UPI003F71DA72